MKQIWQDLEPLDKVTTVIVIFFTLYLTGQLIRWMV